MSGHLYLIPSLLGEAADPGALPCAAVEVLRRLEHFVVETPKQARRFLRSAGISVAGRDVQMQVLDEHTSPARLPELLAPLRNGMDVGLLSDAGCPAVADPGASLVRLAHSEGIRVVPLVGPSAILLALMASGLGGQRFAFHGYLPVGSHARAAALRALESDAQRHGRTQIFIEAPYRNRQLLQTILETCGPHTTLCLATDLTLATESIRVHTIAGWRGNEPDIDRRPTVFLLGGEVCGSEPQALQSRARTRRFTASDVTSTSSGRRRSTASAASDVSGPASARRRWRGRTT